MNAHAPVILLSVLAASFSGCVSSPRWYGDAGLGEQWLILDADDPDVPAVKKQLQREHRRGWSTQLATVTHDDQPRAVIVGPLAYEPDQRDTIEISYSVFADPPVRGRLIFAATPEPSYSLPPAWIDGVERTIAMNKGWQIDSVVVPQLGVPTESLTIRWVTDGLAETAEETTEVQP